MKLPPWTKPGARVYYYATSYPLDDEERYDAKVLSKPKRKGEKYVVDLELGQRYKNKYKKGKIRDVCLESLLPR